MKVAISYAVELEEIPEELQNLIRDVGFDLLASLEDIVFEIQNGSASQVGNNITKTRKNLQKVDTRLDDCQNILLGFVKVKNQLREEGESKKLPPDLSPEGHDTND